MEEVIKLAIEKGGYTHIQINDDDYPINPKSLLASALLLDPLFWQALGKALGWGNRIEASAFMRGKEWVKGPDLSEIPMWLYYWHRFIDWIADGKDPDLFFKELLCPPSSKK